MKLFLASLASATLDLAYPLLPDKPSSLKLAFIPTAADPYGDIPMPWMQAERDKLVRMGFLVTDYDLKDKDIDTLRNHLANFQIIFVAGGNTFYLLSEVRKSGFDILVKEFLDRGGIYIGSSAGSIIMGPDLAHVLLVDHPEAVPALVDYGGLGFVNQRILPHYGNEKYKDRHEKILAEWGTKLVPLRDNQAVIVNDGETKIVTN